MQSFNTKILGHDAEVTLLSAKAAAKLEAHKACSLFPPIDDVAFETLTRSINMGGFDDNQPIVVWRKNPAQKRPDDLLVDGYHRRKAALQCEKEEIPTAYVDFANEAQVVDFVLIANLGRRHLTPPAKKDLRRKLLAMGKSVKEIAAVVGESPSATSHALAPELKVQREERQAAVQAEIIKETPTAKAAATVGVSEATVERAKAAAKKPPKLSLVGGKSVPNAGATPKYNAACDDVFGKKFPVFANTFRKAATLQSNPVPLAEQLPLAKECWAAISETERGDKEKGINAIARWMGFQWPMNGSGRRVEQPELKPSNVVKLPTPAPVAPVPAPVPAAKRDELRDAVKKAEPKTIEQALDIMLALRQEVGPDTFFGAVHALFQLVNTSCIEHPTVPREKRLAELAKAALGERAPAAPAPAPAAPAKGKGKGKGKASNGN